MTDHTLIIEDSDALNFVTADNLVMQLKADYPLFLPSQVPVSRS